MEGLDTTIGIWATGVVVVFLLFCVATRDTEEVSDRLEELTDMVYGRLSAALTMAFTLALLYLIFWGSYRLGESILRAVGLL